MKTVHDDVSGQLDVKEKNTPRKAGQTVTASHSVHPKGCGFSQICVECCPINQADFCLV
jgi:hypothetical protein